MRLTVMCFLPPPSSGAVTETFVCESMVGKETAFKPIISTAVRADFITPLLEMSSPTLHFDYTWELDVPLALESKPLTLTNRSELPLTFLLRAQPPFSIDLWEHSLKPGDSTTVNVVFDAGYRSDRKSHKVDSKVVVAYANHPQRDEVALHAEINYPNLDFEFTQVNFGCVLNDTTKTMLVRVTNPSTVDAAFQWYFVEDEGAQTTTTAKKPYIPINQVGKLGPCITPHTPKTPHICHTSPESCRLMLTALWIAIRRCLTSCRSAPACGRARARTWNSCTTATRTASSRARACARWRAPRPPPPYAPPCPG
jgi:hypothetical protein